MSSKIEKGKNNIEEMKKICVRTRLLVKFRLFKK